MKRRKEKKKKHSKEVIRIGTLNVSSMTGISREIVDLMQRRKMNVLCTQETRWKGAKAREVREGYKLYYYGVENGRNGIGIILEKELVEQVVKVNRISDWILWMKLQLNGEIANILSVYAPQVGCTEQEKDEFWELLDESVGKIPLNLLVLCHPVALLLPDLLLAISSLLAVVPVIWKHSLNGLII